MAPSEEMFLVRRIEDGTMRTILARGSVRNAMRTFVARYGPALGEDYAVKLRGGPNWTYFRVTSRGIQELSGP